ncbi:MAG: hypothetical protein WC836_02765 [Desulfobacula sp.]|jgi:hypothetical protein
MKKISHLKIAKHKTKNKDMETELKEWFIRYFKYLESSNSSFFCENIGILEQCARDRIDYQWEDRILDNIEIVKRRYPDLYEKMLRHLLNWTEKIKEAKADKIHSDAIIFLETYRQGRPKQ